MISLPEQLSAARKWQFDAQLDFFRTFTTQVLTRTEQVIALNLDTSRAAVERSSNAVKQLFAINDPRDLVTLGSQGQAQFEQMLAYSRELFSIASGAQAPRAPQVATPWPRPAASAPSAQPAAPAPQAAPAAEQASVRAANNAAPAHADSAHSGEAFTPSQAAPAATFPEAGLEPAAQATPIAKAVGTLAAQPVEPQHPLSSPVAAADSPVDIPPIAPVEAAPPPAPVSGTPEIEVKQAQRAKAKGNRKK